MALKLARKPYQGLNKRRKWVYQCNQCMQWFPRDQVEAHHIHPCGELKTFADLSGFAERLFCEVDGFEVLCNDCHAKH